MHEDELYAHIFDSQIFKHWHWFSWHFEHKLRGGEHPLSKSIVQACLDCEKKIPKFAPDMIDCIASISGKEKYEPHYEQLLQRLTELHVIRQIVTYDWPYEVQFQWEPTAGESKNNPEITVEANQEIIAVEVKTPSLLNHIRKRTTNLTQLPTRLPFREALPNEEVTLPRDNPVKDFLLSANEKFQIFKEQYKNFTGILVIVWDDFVYEPITALISQFSGLFTENSFAKNNEGQPIKFENVDSVVIIRHLHQIIHATRDEQLIDSCKHALDYGRDGEYPPKAFIPNPNGIGSYINSCEGSPDKLFTTCQNVSDAFIPPGRYSWKPLDSVFKKDLDKSLPKLLLNCLQAYPLSLEMGAEYMPTDWIQWKI